MNKVRVMYMITVCIVIATGLLSRYWSFVPLWIGDLLYAVMAYFIMRVLWPSQKLYVVILLSLLFCYLIEFSQLYQAPWINRVRQTLLGRLVLGQGFLWSDIIVYTIGVRLAAWLDIAFIRRKSG